MQYTVLQFTCPTDILSYSRTVSLSQLSYNIVLLSHCHTVVQSYCPMVILSYCRTVLVPYGHTVPRLYYHIGCPGLLYYYNIIWSCCPTVILSSQYCLVRTITLSYCPEYTLIVPQSYYGPILSVPLSYCPTFLQSHCHIILSCTETFH